MRLIEIDFVRRRPVWMVWLILGIALLIAFDMGRSYFEAKRSLALGDRPPEVQPRAIPTEENVSAQTQRELDQARRVLVELSLPWDALFRSVEAAAGKNVALLSIEPDVGRGQVRITGEARDYVSALNFLVRLEEGRTLERVHLLNHELREEDPQRPYRITLVGHWRTQP
jgi:hypothetical protein